MLACARFIIERDGVAALSMHAVAREIGVRAPSLYKRFANRAALVVAVELEVLDELAALLTRAAGDASPAVQLRAMARAHRRFALAHPKLYGLVLSGETIHDAAATEARRRATLPMIHAFAQLVGEKEALPAARVLTAFLHGFVSMELASEFRLGPGVEAAFRRGLDLIIGG